MSSRQRQRWKGWGLWWGGKGSSSPSHKGKQITPTHFVHLQPLPSQGFRHLLALVSPYMSLTGVPVRAHPRPHEFNMDLHLDQWNWIQDPEINPHSYSQPVLNKGAKNTHWRKDSKWCQENWLCTCQRLKLDSYTKTTQNGSNTLI
jgi:hypothetical protein